MTIPSVTVGGTVFHLPFRDLLPPLPAEDLERLRADIRARGVAVPVVVDEGNHVLDGANRVTIAAELGLTEVPVVVQAGLDERGRRGLALTLNLCRRHLTRAQVRALVARLLRADPEQSDRAVAAAAGTTDKTVAAERRRLEAGAEIPHPATTRGRDGKVQARRAGRAARPTPATPPKAGKAAAAETPPEGRPPTRREAAANPMTAPAAPCLRLSWTASVGQLRTFAEGLAGQAPRLRRVPEKLRTAATLLGYLGEAEKGLAVLRRALLGP
jgi:site-specific DNA-methyltransferase (adenine-specific)